MRIECYIIEILHLDMTDFFRREISTLESKLFNQVSKCVMFIANKNYDLNIKFSIIKKYKLFLKNKIFLQAINWRFI